MGVPEAQAPSPLHPSPHLLLLTPLVRSVVIQSNVSPVVYQVPARTALTN